MKLRKSIIFMALILINTALFSQSPDPVIKSIEAEGLYKFSYPDDKIWEITKTDDGYYRIRNNKLGRYYLYVDGYNNVKWNNGELSESTKWEFIQSEVENYYYIRNVYTNYYITSNSSQLQQINVQSYSGNDDQKYVFINCFGNNSIILNYIPGRGVLNSQPNAVVYNTVLSLDNYYNNDIIYGNYQKQSINGIEYISINKKTSTVIKIDNTAASDAVLWMRAKAIFINDDLAIYFNNEKVNFKYIDNDFHWIKIADVRTGTDRLEVKINNNVSTLEIDRFLLTTPDVAPFADEYLFEDIVADFTDDYRVRVNFSGKNLVNAQVTLYVQSTAETLYTIFKDTVSDFLNFEPVRKVLEHLADPEGLNDPFTAYKTVTITDESEYSITGEDQFTDTGFDGYEFKLYLQATNCFGESIKSRKVFVSLDNFKTLTNFKNKFNLNDDPSFTLSDHQDKLWKFINDENNFYKIKNKETDRYNLYSYTDFTVKINSGQDDETAKWEIINIPFTDLYRLKNRYYGKYLTVDADYNLKVADDSADYDQIFRIIPVENNYCLIDPVKSGAGVVKSIDSYTVKYDDVYLVNEDGSNFNEPYSFNKSVSQINLTTCFVRETGLNENIYLYENDKIDYVPLFLKDSSFLVTDYLNNYVNFNAEKDTDIYIYVPNYKEVNAEYYYNKGYKLVRLPKKFSTVSADNYSYFYHKRFRAGTGDAVFLSNDINYNTAENSFYTARDNNDAIVYFNTDNTALSGNESLYVRIRINGGAYNDYPMVRIVKNTWFYKITDAFDNNGSFTFEFRNGTTILSSQEWIWSKSLYLSQYDTKKSNVVFFKVLDTDDESINFNNKYNSQYLDFNGYLIDDGTAYSSKGKQVNYGASSDLIINYSDIPFTDNVKGYYDGSRLKIEYNSLNTGLVDKEFIEIRYSYDGWQTNSTGFMQQTGYNKWTVDLYPSGTDSKISFNFYNGDITEDNNHCNWNWFFTEKAYFNYGYEENYLKRNYIELPSINDMGEDFEWKADVENGIYDIYILMEKTTPAEDAVMNINGKSYQLNPSFKEIIELRDRVMVLDGTVRIKNSGVQAVKLYSVNIIKDKKQIYNKTFNYTTIENADIIDNTTNDGNFITFNNDDVIKINYTMTGLNAGEKLELVLNAVSNNSDLLSFAKGSSFNESDLLSIVKLNNDIRSYSINLSEYVQDIINNSNNFTLYIKAKKGTRILINSDVCPINIDSYILIDTELYQSVGTITNPSGSFLFTEHNGPDSYTSTSERYDLNDYLNALVLVSGYIENGQLVILKIEPAFYIRNITGDSYSNNQSLTWHVESDFNLTHLTYRIQGVVDWTTVPFGTSGEISQSIPDEGRYVLDVIPEMYGLKGLQYSYNFIVDRTGPLFYILSELPEITSQRQFQLDIDIYDNFSSDDEITLYYTDNSGDETLIPKSNNIADLNLEGITEGEHVLRFYAKDLAGNIGNETVKTIIFDFTPPVLEDIEVSYDFGYDENNVKYQYVAFNFITSDNFTFEDRFMTTYYNISNSEEWQDTTSDRIKVNFNEFAEDGEYTIIAYVKDFADLTSDINFTSFKIDRTPLPMPSSYEGKIDDIYFSLTWENSSYVEEFEEEFLSYNIRRSPDFNFGLDSSYLDTTSDVFIDTSSLYNPDFIYFVSVTDIYGNVSDGLECPAMKYHNIEGEIGDKVTLDMDCGNFEVTIDEKTPHKIGYIKKVKTLDKRTMGEYKFFNDEIYHFEPHGAVFKNAAIWYLDAGNIKKPADNTSDITEYKKKITMYTHNFIRNLWEEVETDYDSVNDRFIVKMKHFSDDKEGEEKENRVSVPARTTEVSPEDGSLDVVFDLFSLNSNRLDYNLKLKFNSKRFDNMSKFVLNEYIFKYDKKYYLWSTWDVHALQDRVKDWGDDAASDPGVCSSWTIEDSGNEWVNEPGEIREYLKKKLMFPKFRGEFLNVKDDLNQNFNNIDNCWNLNIPQLLRDNTADNDAGFKYITLMDGNEYELKTSSNMYYNKTGTKFIYKVIDSGYLVKLENNINYRFNEKGQLEYIFYSGNPEAEITGFDGGTKNNRIMYTFVYDETHNNITDIYAYDKDHIAVKHLTFFYSDPITGYNDNNYYIKRIDHIDCKIINGTTEKVIARTKFNYSDIVSNNSSGLSYLPVFSHNDITDNNKKEKIIIHYERLDKVSYYYFDNDYTGTSNEEDYLNEEKSINYETNGTQYQILNSNNEKLNNIGDVRINYIFGPKNCCKCDMQRWNNRKTFRNIQAVKNCLSSVDKNVLYDSSGYDEDVGNFLNNVFSNPNPDNVLNPFHFSWEPDWYYFDISNFKIRTLSKITIDEKDKVREYSFNQFKIGDDTRYTIYEDNIVSFCENEKIKVKDKNNNVSSEMNIDYFYKVNADANLMPFRKSLMMMPVKDYSLSSRSDSNINTRQFDLSDSVHTKYKFVENTIGYKIGITSRKEGVYVNNAYPSNGDLTNDIERDTGYFANYDRSIEDILDADKIFYKEKSYNMNLYNQVTAEINRIKDKSDPDKKILSFKRSFYDDIYLINERFYINEFESIEKDYTYFVYNSGDATNDKDHRILNPQVETIEEDYDGINKLITENDYTRNTITGAYQLNSKSNYINNSSLSRNITYNYNNTYDLILDQTENNLITEYGYDNLNRVNKISKKGETMSSASPDLTDEGIITKKYFDNRSGLLVAEEHFRDGDYNESTKTLINGSVKLYYYDYEGKKLQDTVLYYKNSDNTGDAMVRVYFNENMMINSEVYVINGFYSKSTGLKGDYLNYYNAVKNKDTSLAYLDYIDDNITAYYTGTNGIINKLISKKFNFKDPDLISLGYTDATVSLNYMNIPLLKENYKKRPEGSTADHVTKTIETYQRDNNGNIINKKLDDQRNGLIYSYIYNNLGDLESEISPVPGSPVISYFYEYNDYGKRKTTEVRDGEDNLMSRITENFNAFGYLMSKSYYTTDGSLGYTESYDYNNIGLLIEKTGIEGLKESYTYNIFGTVDKRITGYDGKTQLVQHNEYDTEGHSINSYSNIALNQNFDKDNWSTQNEYDDFGNVIKEKVKYDIDILYSGHGKTDGEYYTKKTIYDIYFNKPMLETTDRYAGFTGDIIKLDDVEYTYTYFGELETKTYYEWSYSLDSLVTYIEEYKYDQFKRLIQKTVKRNNDIISKTLIADYDAGRNVIEQYDWVKGRNWIYSYNKYNISNKLVYSEKRVLNSSDSAASLTVLRAAPVFMVNKMITKYDDYNRIITQIDFDGNGKSYEYDLNFTDKVSREYSGTNFKYNYTLTSNNDLITGNTYSTVSSISYTGYNSTQYIKNDYSMIGNLVKTEMSGSFNKEISYDEYGRKEAETLNRYMNEEQKYTHYIYDSLGRIVKTVSDDVTAEVTSWETENSSYTRETVYTISKPETTALQPYTITENYTLYGNIQSNTDKYGYYYESRTDIFGNVISKVKKPDSNASISIFTETNQYDSSKRLLTLKTINSGLTGAKGKKYAYSYDDLNRISTLLNYDVEGGADSIMTTKIFDYKNDNQVASVATTIDTETYTVQYNYREDGVLKEVIYPDNRKFENVFTYGMSTDSGKISNIKFNNEYIINNIGYYTNNNSTENFNSVVTSYKNNAGIWTYYDFNNARKLKEKTFENSAGDEILKQTYQYDMSGNITEVSESGTETESGLLGLFDRVFTYDSYNRLILAEYEGSVTARISPKLTYREYDHIPVEQSLLTSEDLGENGNDTVNIESKASSVLISDKNSTNQGVTPLIIKILKQKNSLLKNSKIKTYYSTETGFTELISPDIMIDSESDADYFVLKDINLTEAVRAFKINFVPDNTDASDDALVDTNLDKNLGDLIEVYSSLNKIDFQYTYDGADNRTGEKVLKYDDNSGTMVLNHEESFGYIYSPDRRFLLSDNNFSYAYDEDGFLKGKRSLKDNTGWKYTWDAAGFLREIIKYTDANENSLYDDGEAILYQETNVYDESGMKIKSVRVEGEKTDSVITIYNEGKIIYEKTTSDGETKIKDFVYAFKELQLIVDNNVKTYYYSDILGSTRFVTNDAGNIVQENIFEPFGKELLHSCEVEDCIYTYQFAGHNGENKETGLIYMNARWMDTETGRFISPDPAKQGINWYVY
ncbi:MAG: hypothetical protein JXB50_15865, partial [Spirochaetes bacterium]|nr:hypothetical protein [Spirochaetota bacterium]